MAWTYSGDPSSSAIDAVRFTIGDTDSSDPLLSNEEITYLLGLYGQVIITASIRACEMIMAKFSRLANESVGSVRIDFSQKTKGYKDMVMQLKARLAVEDCTPFAGGISKTQKQTTIADSDRVEPDFTKHMMENEQIAPWVTNGNQDLNGDGEPD